MARAPTYGKTVMDNPPLALPMPPLIVATVRRKRTTTVAARRSSAPAVPMLWAPWGSNARKQLTVRDGQGDKEPSELGDKLKPMWGGYPSVSSLVKATKKELCGPTLPGSVELLSNTSRVPSLPIPASGCQHCEIQNLATINYKRFYQHDKPTLL